MAWKHRKLFPTNQTQDCYGYCDPACPYNCYSYPDYYFSPPPPATIDHSVNPVSSYFVILLSLFAILFLLVGFYVIKVKCYADWCGWRFDSSVPSSQSNNLPEDEFLNENQADHPVWLIATVGLQQSIINSIAVCKYKKDEGLVEGTECSVCLNTFQEGETLRLLPKCNHAFHIPCIDTWLRSHTNCPLCRAGVVSISSNANSEAAVMSNSSSAQQDSTDSRRNQEAGVENSRNDDGLSNDMVSAEALGNNDGTGEASEATELTGESISNKEQPNVDRYDHVPRESEIRPVSPVPGLANSSSREPEIRRIEDKHDDDTELNTSKTMRSSSIEECLHVSPVSMKRSFSCSARILCSRGYMCQNSTLPC